MFGMTSVVERPKKARSGLTGNAYFLPGVDMRSPRGRRYRDIVAGLIATFGDSDPDALRDLATSRLALEDVQAEVIAGVASAREDMVRIGNLIARREAALREAAIVSRCQPPSRLDAMLSGAA